jgi:uncharacterized membrane protein YeaQ/YmgE (transglycosylase-associated protein family)
MVILDFLLLLVVAAIVGALGQGLAGYSSGGCMTSMLIGFIGALIGTWLSRALRLPELFTVHVGPAPFPILWSIIGAALFVAVLALLRYPRRI